MSRLAGLRKKVSEHQMAKHSEQQLMRPQIHQQVPAALLNANGICMLFADTNLQAGVLSPVPQQRGAPRGSDFDADMSP